MAVAAETAVRPMSILKDLWRQGKVLGFATGKRMMYDFYLSHGYPADQTCLYDPEKRSPEPEVHSSSISALHKVRMATTSPWLEDRADLWIGVDVLTGISEKNPYNPRADVEWDFHLKAGRERDHKNPEHVESLTQELTDRYNREFWSLWEMTWAMGSKGSNFFASMSLSVIGHYPNGLPEKTIRRALVKNPHLAFKIGPGIDLASQYHRHGDNKAMCVSCSGGEIKDEFTNKQVSSNWLVNLAVFRYLTQHQMAKGLIAQFKR